MGPQGTWAQWRFRPLCQFLGESTWGVAGPLGERHLLIRSVSAHTGTSNVPRKDDQMHQHFRRPACDGTNETVGIWHCNRSIVSFFPTDSALLHTSFHADGSNPYPPQSLPPDRDNLSAPRSMTRSPGTQPLRSRIPKRDVSCHNSRACSWSTSLLVEPSRGALTTQLQSL